MKLKILSVAMMTIATTHTVMAADEIRTMQENADNWVSAAGNYNNQRYSTLNQITKDSYTNFFIW